MMPLAAAWRRCRRARPCRASNSDVVRGAATDAKHEEFAVDPWCTPKRVRNTHVSNELTNLQWCLRSATARSRFPAPIGSEAGTVPANHRFWFEDFQSVQYARSQTIQSRKHQTVALLAHSPNATACPQPAEADIRPLDGNSRFGAGGLNHPINSLRKRLELARNALTGQIGYGIGGWPGDAGD